MSTPLRIEAEPIEVPLVHPARIARGTSTYCRTAAVRVRTDDGFGIGECAPIERYGESVDSVLAYYRALPASLELRDFDSVLRNIPLAARCGLDIALHDLLGKRAGMPLWELFGLDRLAISKTSFTIFIDDIATMIDEVNEHRDAPVLKIKLGAGSELETVEAVRAIYSGTLRIDANEGWSPEQAVSLLTEMERYDLEFCEQPVPAGHPEQLRWIKERVRIPLLADEDSIIAADVPKLAGCVDGINVKLAKCGGIRAAQAMIQAARLFGMKVMLGCMTETSVLITAAGHLAPMVDWLDLDGNLLLQKDPFSGMTHDRGTLTLPDGPGLGLLEV